MERPAVAPAHVARAHVVVPAQPRAALGEAQHVAGALDVDPHAHGPRHAQVVHRGEVPDLGGAGRHAGAVVDAQARGGEVALTRSSGPPAPARPPRARPRLLGQRLEPGLHQAGGPGLERPPQDAGQQARAQEPREAGDEEGVSVRRDGHACCLAPRRRGGTATVERPRRGREPRDTPGGCVRSPPCPDPVRRHPPAPRGGSDSTPRPGGPRSSTAHVACSPSAGRLGVDGRDRPLRRVQRGLLHHYFGDKHDLYVAVVRDLLAQFGLDHRRVGGRPRRRRARNQLDEVVATYVDRWLGLVERHADSWFALLDADPAGRDPEVAGVVPRAEGAMVDGIVTAGSARWAPRCGRCSGPTAAACGGDPRMVAAGVARPLAGAGAPRHHAGRDGARRHAVGRGREASTGCAGSALSRSTLPCRSSG